jgi:signal transduction histidine kinase
MKKLIGFILIVFAAANLCAQNSSIDSLKHALSAAKDDSDKIRLLSFIAQPYMWNTPDTAIKYAIRAWQLVLKADHPGSSMLYPAGILSEALSAKGNYSKALEIDLQALQMAKESDKSDLFFSIGNVYFYSGDYAKALEYYLKAISTQSAPGRVILGTIGESYFHLGNLDSALYYINKSYQIDKKDTHHWSVPYFYLALIHSKKKEYQEALSNYRLGLLYAKENNAYLDIVDGSNGIADIFKQLQQVDSAIYYAGQAITLGQAQSLNPGVLKASALLTELYLKINTDSAFKYQRIMLALKDSLFSQDKIKQLENISFNEKIRQDEILQKQKEYQNRIRTYGLIAGLILFLIIAFFLYKNNRHKQKAFVLLQEQKQETDHQKAEVEKTLDQLKSTQKQLIQSEKMASLGELTAGIAHEIQNPLNFVNNFSEINHEMLEELNAERIKPKAERDEELESAILKDIKENEEKILHHGKRADAIVKGMLQHSRSSTGVKEPTDINALADEYLRLSYHGLRAKDKSFNADMKTDFDNSIGKINIIPQDIGRVLLNLFNNAFYACTERSQSEVNEQKSRNLISYEPIVSVTTKKLENHVCITVSDNGNGIPQKVVDKIFQPFFTTKPTGQGTGLGLSLSYDIVKAHGGEIKVNTKENEGTEFTIALPIK